MKIAPLPPTGTPAVKGLRNVINYGAEEMTTTRAALYLDDTLKQFYVLLHYTTTV